MLSELLALSSHEIQFNFALNRYEQIFVYNLLLHLQCDDIDDEYKPVHGLGAVANVPIPKKQHRNRSRRRE